MHRFCSIDNWLRVLITDNWWLTLLYHVTFQVHTCRRKEVENKHHAAAKESTSEQQRFD